MRGDSANDLISFVADPNVSIQESKAFTGNIRAGRHKAERRVAWHEKREDRGSATCPACAVQARLEDRRA